MRRLVFGLASIVLVACTNHAAVSEPMERAQAQPLQTREGGLVEQQFDGPGIMCGAAFALGLMAGERAIRRDPQLDFLTYHVEGSAGGFVLYEGNAPQPADDRIETRLNWPTVIAIHDNRDEAAKRQGRIRNRLILGDRRQRICGTLEIRQ